MSANLVQEVKDMLSGSITEQAGTALGESPSVISKALSAIVPAIFGSLIQKVNTPGGDMQIANLTSAETKPGTVTDDIQHIIAGDGGSGILNSLFNNTSSISTSVSNFAGIKPANATTLLGIAGTAIVGFLGRYFQQNNVSNNALAGLLNGQKQNVQDALPAGLNMANLLGTASTPVATQKAVTTPLMASPSKAATTYAPDENTGNGSPLKFFLPLLLLALISVAALYFFKSGRESHEAGSTKETLNGPHDSTHTIGSHQTMIEDSTTGEVDTLGNYIYELGANTSVVLPNNGGTLSVGEFSTEAKLVKFLQGNESLDSAKGNWFDFTNVYFNSGKSDITEASNTQLQNIVKIAKAFPKAKFKIGGYTDNSGNEAANVSLSRTRAAMVSSKLKAMGAGSSIVSSDGYGSQFSLADNASAEGRAQNRRVSLNVKAK